MVVLCIFRLDNTTHFIQSKLLTTNFEWITLCNCLFQFFQMCHPLQECHASVKTVSFWFIFYRIFLPKISNFLGSIYRRGARRWRKLYRINGHIFQAKRFSKVSVFIDVFIIRWFQRNWPNFSGDTFLLTFYFLEDIRRNFVFKVQEGSLHFLTSYLKS